MMFLQPDPHRFLRGKDMVDILNWVINPIVNIGLSILLLRDDRFF